MGGVGSASKAAGGRGISVTFVAGRGGRLLDAVGKCSAGNVCGGSGGVGESLVRSMGVILATGLADAPLGDARLCRRSGLARSERERERERERLLGRDGDNPRRGERERDRAYGRSREGDLEYL